MLRLAADADVHGDIVRGLRLLLPALDLVRVQDAGLRSAEDPLILEWAAGEGRVFITADRNTMVGFAWDRVKRGLRMPGLLALKPKTGIGEAIDELALIAECLAPEECENFVRFVPL
jgi:hypothetical protein